MDEKEAMEKLYDEAAGEYRAQCTLLQVPSLSNSAKGTARYNARIWKTRMTWLDSRLAKLGEK